MVLELDCDGIAYLTSGLIALRDCEPGETLDTPSLAAEDDGTPIGVTSFILLRAEDQDE